MKRFIFYLSLTILVCSCNTDKRSKAQIIVDMAIEVAGGDKFNNSVISFDFRGRHYKAKRNGGIYEYSREFRDSINLIKDVLSNDGFERLINGEITKVPDSMVPRYSRSVNSVHYFSVLPFGLNDAAVQKEYLGEVEIKGKQYHKIKVFFSEEGGGDDFEDVFMYWIGTDDHKVDYLAYSYQDPGRDMDYRFRVAKNERYVNSIRFVDYDNYKSEAEGTTLNKLDELYEAGSLKLLSKIENENVKVE